MSPARCTGVPERRVGTRKLTGTLDGVRVADNLHLVIRKDDGQTESFQVARAHSPGLEYFLVAHAGRKLDLEAEEVESCVPEAGTTQRLERLSGARMADGDWTSWWRETGKDTALVRSLRARYERMQAGERASRGAVRAIPLDAAALRQARDLAIPECPHLRIEEKHSFRLEAPGSPHDGTSFVTITCHAAAKVRFLQVRGGEILHDLRSHPANAWSVFSVDAITFRDVDGDSLFDIVAMVSAMTGIGPTGAQPFPVAGLWLGTPEGKWRPDKGAAALLDRERPANLRKAVRALHKHFRRR